MPTSRSIRTRVLSYIIITVSIALFGLHTSELYQTYNEFKQELDRRLSIYLESTADTLADRMWELDKHSVRVIVDGFVKDPDFAYVEVIDSQGRLVAQVTGIHSRENVTSKRIPLILSRNNLELGQVYLELSRKRLFEQQKALLTRGLLINSFTLLIVITVIVFSFRRITDPLDELTKVMKNLAQDKLSIPIPYLDRKDEIGQISKAVEVFKHYAVDRQALLAKQSENEKMLMYQAHHDALTDLPNRFLIMDRMTQHIYEAERHQWQVALMFVDLDDFKKINDSLGHEFGDKLLVEAANRMKSIVRSSDTVGRHGGDEFIVILGDLRNLDAVRKVAEQIIQSLSKPFNVDNHELTISASIGIAVYPDDGNGASDLLRKADSAMYHAKDQGGNIYAFFTEEMNQEVSRRLAIEQAMRGALERQEFEVLYQPLMDVKSGQIIGTEALLRWHSGGLGTIMPDEFIPIAEQTSMIVEIGEFVLYDALQHTAEWNRSSGKNLKASVNISPRQFRDPMIIEKITNALSACDIAAENLTLELTEGVLLSGDTLSHTTMAKANALGISIAMDDFGTGYSSLSYLRSFPFDIVKVDRSFVNDITYEKDDAELVQSAIAMAHGLNLKVVAEGVETEEQLAMLQTMGCDIVQGYLLGKPMPASAFQQKLQQS